MDENSKKIDFFKTSQFFTPTMIDEKTQLGKVVSLLKGLERHLRPENEKSIFYFKKIRALCFYTGNGDETQFLE